MKMLCAGLVLFWTGLAAGYVGRFPENHLEAYSWTLPVTMFFLLAPVAITAYLAGLEEKS